LERLKHGDYRRHVALAFGAKCWSVPITYNVGSVWANKRSISSDPIYFCCLLLPGIINWRNCLKYGELDFKTLKASEVEAFLHLRQEAA
jgi:hypothetical protein